MKTGKKKLVEWESGRERKGPFWKNCYSCYIDIVMLDVKKWKIRQTGNENTKYCARANNTCTLIRYMRSLKHAACTSMHAWKWGF